jgi:hypothetical protein
MISFKHAVVLMLSTLWGTSLFAQQPTVNLDRSVLPIPEPKPPVYTELDASKVTPPSRFEVKTPDGAPNVVIVLIDDLGFAGTSAFGGPIGTPSFDRIAQEGFCYDGNTLTLYNSSDKVYATEPSSGTSLPMIGRRRSGRFQ